MESQPLRAGLQQHTTASFPLTIATLIFVRKPFLLAPVWRRKELFAERQEHLNPVSGLKVTQSPQVVLIAGLSRYRPVGVSGRVLIGQRRRTEGPPLSCFLTAVTENTGTVELQLGETVDLPLNLGGSCPPGTQHAGK